MKDASEDEQEEDLVLPSSNRSKVDSEARRKSKAQREEQIRQMMDADGKKERQSSQHMFTKTLNGYQMMKKTNRQRKKIAREAQSMKRNGPGAARPTRLSRQTRHPRQRRVQIRPESDGEGEGRS